MQRKPKHADSSPGVENQTEIYKHGLMGREPAQSISIENLEQEAKKALKLEVFDYLAGGAGAEDTIRANWEAFQRWRIVPRVLRDVVPRDLGVTLLGQQFASPILLAPLGVQSILHKDAELAVARAARSLDVPLVLSTVSSRTIEEVAEELGDSPRWFQLYWPANSDLAASFLRRAENAGYSAIVVTLDTFLMSWRERDLQNAYLPFLKVEGLANFFSDPVFRDAIGGSSTAHPIRAVEYFLEIFGNPALTWNDLSFLRNHTRLPILLKGILDPEDARMAVDHGVDGIIVSNHGGRQVDGAIAALDALPDVSEAVAGHTTVLFDSGIRRGADDFKAICLGAQAVLLGRPYCFGLALNGEQGVRDVVRNLLSDLDLTLGLAGCASVKELSHRNLKVAPMPELRHARPLLPGHD